MHHLLTIISFFSFFSLRIKTSIENRTLCEKTTDYVNISIVADDADGNKTGYPGGYRLIEANGCPGYLMKSLNNPYKAYAVLKTIKLPLQPILMKRKFYTGIKKENGSMYQKNLYGPIGMAVNGVFINNNVDLLNHDIMLYSRYEFDSCYGHIHHDGSYQYHSEPIAGCVFNDTQGKHSPLFGYMFDGIPIYGSLGDCGISPKDLDECGGHTDKTFSFYHYHLPYNRTFPYIVNCLRGCIFPNNYSPIKKNFEMNLTICREGMNDNQYNFSMLSNKIFCSSLFIFISYNLFILFLFI